LDFTVTPTQVVAGENMTFTWVVTGASTVRLDLYDFYGSTMSGPGRQSWANLPVTGSLTVQMTDTQRGWYRFVLWADPATAYTYVAETVYYNCTDAFFFAPIQSSPGPPCPAGPAVPIQVTQQAFEHGLMLWLDGEDVVYILYNRDPFPPNGIVVAQYNLAGKISAPENDPIAVPPAGKYHPINIVGGVWQQYNLRQTLGWALAPEQTFESLIQFDYPGWPFYLRAADGRILAIKYHWGPHYDDPSWSYLTP
jgi:hypothetical protein